MTTTTVLGFGCHPDDVEFTCAGTLALLKEAGWNVHLATTAGGECGSVTLGREEIRDIRLKECEAAAAVLGALFTWAGGEDLELDFSHDLRGKVTDVIRQVRPEVVITMPSSDYMNDHEETSRLVRYACFGAPMPNVKTPGFGPIDHVPHLYYTDAMDGIDVFGRPLPIAFYVDITPVMDVKEQMLACHASQREWLRAHHGIDEYIEHMKRQAAARGKKAGVRYAEAFIQHLGHGYPHDNVIAKALEKHVIPATEK
jgi:LmbE family N-acetylglucosaminyl deacetylase